MNEHQQDRHLDDLVGGTGPQGPSDLDGEKPTGPQGPAGLDEERLRRLLQDVTERVEPSAGSLEEIRKAVPLRRARRRQALVGVAAGVLLVGTALPALVSVAGSTTDSGRNAAAAASSREAGTVQGAGEDTGGGTGAVGPTQQPEEGTPAGAGEQDGRPGAASAAEGTGLDPEATMAATSPTCTRSQLQQPAPTVGEPGEDGKIYGSFRVVNNSGSACTIDGRGTVTAVAQGSADDSQVSVVDHTSGDAADQLPEPTAYQDQLILKPGQAYLVKFAWVPAGGGPGGCRVPDDSPTPSSPSAVGASDAPAPEDEPGTGAAGSIQLSHTPQAGEPAAGVTIQDACAGTVYRTGILDSST